MKQPVSTWTCLAYLVAGIWITTVHSGFLPVFTAMLIINLTWTSGGFHWTLEGSWQKLDRANIYALLPPLLLWQAAGATTGSGYLDAVAVILALFMGITSLYSWWDHKIIGLLGAMAIALIPLRAGPPEAVIALLLFGIGFWIGREEVHGDPSTYHDLKHGLRHVIWAGALLVGVL